MSSLFFRPRVTTVNIPRLTAQVLIGTASAAWLAARAARSVAQTAKSAAVTPTAWARMASQELARATAVDALAVACVNASASVGYASIEVHQVSAIETRIVASNAKGQSLVNEIRVGDGGETSLATEVVGIREPLTKGPLQCETLQNQFAAALEAQGVRSGPTKRTYTGGVLLLKSAREVARRFGRQLTPATLEAKDAPDAPATHAEAKRRTAPVRSRARTRH